MRLFKTPSFLLVFVTLTSSHATFGQESVSESASVPANVKVENQKEAQAPPLVEEEYFFIKYGTEKEKKFVPYRERRQTWGFMFSLGYSLYKPDNYTPDFETSSNLQDFETIYGDSSSGSPELTLSAKLNTAAGAIQLGLGGGYYSVSSSDAASVTTTLSVTVLRLEGALILDTLFPEPYVAPYVIGGIYTAVYDESSEDQGSVDGNTQMTGYFGVGANIQLNWLEEKTARRSYFDYGIENAFFFIEAKAYQEPGGTEDPDFSTEMQVAGGLRVEL